ncbi:MAG: glycoside hydrolase [Armatimonadetes bacterium 55-13]|nr:glycoside hydrolase 43 family protein [Armatimonadota bacterium]OJU63393.1 MAG: glycoside hydrolase [Armatimonadetes bacterium 55-13]
MMFALTMMVGMLAGVLPSQVKNPTIWADVPDPAIIRVGRDYYMSSTTMHMSPGLPIMKSRNLVDWKLVSYAYQTLGDTDELNLANGKNAYGKGSWASSLRYHNGTFCASTFSFTTGKTYIYTTKNIEKGPWKTISFSPAFHDHSLFFDDDGRVYLITGAEDIRLVELKADLTGPKPGGIDQIIVRNASKVAGGEVGLRAEGSQLFKVNGKYYLCNITWPKGGMRTEIVHRADSLTGPYEGRIMFQDRGIAQGGIIDTPDGQWYAYLFQDHGAVGRIPYLMPMTWEDGWPKVQAPEALNVKSEASGIPAIVASDEFTKPQLPLVWQWNHNPDAAHWSLTARPGFLRLTTSRVDKEVVEARNTLTQRTFGPLCSGTIRLDATGLKDGDFAGLLALQGRYGFVGVTRTGSDLFWVSVNAGSGSPKETARQPMKAKIAYLRIDCNFMDRKDEASFYMSEDGKSWTPFGEPLKMRYDLTHFMGYRYGLFAFSTQSPGGFADFDYFHIGDRTLDRS